MDNPQVSGEPPTPLTEARPRTHFPDPKSLHTKGQFTLLHHYIKNIYTMTTSLPTLSWFLLLAWTTKSVSATFLFGQNTTQCLSPPDQFIGNAQRVFNMVIWVKRGTCIRGDNDFDCYHNVQYMLQNGLNDLRKAEYAGAAGVLALLPTIGALLGAPTNEIWRLLTLVPFGGVIAMFLSFGGAILPVRIQDYEMDFSKRRQARTTTIGDIDDHDGEEHLDYDSEDVRDNKKLKKERLERIVRRRLQQNESQHIPLQYISFGLTGMILFLFAAQVAMAIIEQGAIVAWWCDSTWWMHLWYFMVTATAIADNYVQMPFKHQWKLFISDIPYEVTCTGGDNITNWNHSGNSVGIALRQLGTLKTGQLTLIGSSAKAKPRNSFIVMISVPQDTASKYHSFLKALSKVCSIGVFAVGTALFASSQFLSLLMACMAITVILCAAVFGRTIAGWIIMGIEQSEPLVHYIAGNTDEATDVIKRLLTVDTSIGLEEGVLARVQRSTTGLDTMTSNNRQYTTTSPLDPSLDFEPISLNPPHQNQNIYNRDLKSSTSPRTSLHSPSQTTETKHPSSPFIPRTDSLFLRKPQVEIQGHIFVDRQRVVRRSVWPLRVLGIMARPFDLGGFYRGQK